MTDQNAPSVRTRHTGGRAPGTGEGLVWSLCQSQLMGSQERAVATVRRTSIDVLNEALSLLAVADAEIQAEIKRRRASS